MSDIVSLPNVPPDVEAYDLAIPPIREMPARRNPIARTGNGAVSDIAVSQQPDPMMSSLERLARDPTIPTDRIVALYELAKDREQTLMRREFMQDMNSFQMEMKQVLRDKPNKMFNSKYATEEQIDLVARPVYTKHGFSITYGTKPSEKPNHICVVCTVAHRGGYFEQHPLDGPVSTTGSQGGKMGASDIQAVGLTLTYLKKDLIQMVLNLVTADNPADNDGNRTRPASGQALYTLKAAFAGINVDVPVLEAMRAKAFDTFTIDDLSALRLVYGAMKNPGTKAGGDAPPTTEPNADPFLRAAAGQPVGGLRPGETLTEDGEIVGGEPPFDVTPPSEPDPGTETPPSREA